MSSSDKRQANISEAIHPRQVRADIRSGNRFMEDTSGTCTGFAQVNLVMIPAMFAEEFEGFCRANDGPMPLLFKSKPGQYTAPPLGDDIDVRTDIGAYEVIENGKKTELVENLMKFNDRIQHHVSFYMGCSYSFEKEYLDAGLPLRAQQQKRSTPLYLTSVQCAPCGVFTNCRQYSSMRPIPKTQLQLATKVTLPMSKYHGAPMHIGDPGMIGVDLSKPDQGDVLHFEEGDIPVFWSCGATGIPAIKECGAELGFTQGENCLLITDRPTEPDDLGNDLHVEVIEVHQDPFFASIVSKSKLEKIKFLMGEHEILKPDELLKSAMALSHSSKVAVLIDETTDIKDTTTNGEIKTGLPALVQVMATLKMEVMVLVPANSSEKFMSDIKAKFSTHAQNIEVERLPNKDGTITSTNNQEIDHVVMMAKLPDTSGSFVDSVRKTLKRVRFTEVTENGINNKSHADFKICMGHARGCQLLASLLVTLRSCPVHERYQRRNVGHPLPAEVMKSLQSTTTV